MIPPHQLSVFALRWEDEIWPMGCRRESRAVSAAEQLTVTLPRLYSITPQADLRSAFRTGLYLYIRVASHRTWPLHRCEEVARLREQEAADVLPGEEGDEGGGRRGCARRNHL